MNKSAVDYIISILLCTDEACAAVAYSAEPVENAGVTIIDSGFFDKENYLTEASVPDAPVCEWRGTPVLFGDCREELSDGRLVIHADLVASSFFLMSRYEELVVKGNRDAHGRYAGEGSFLGKAGLLERPLIDEYGACLRQAMREAGFDIAEPEEAGTVYLTHDVDIPYRKWGLMQALRQQASMLKHSGEFHIWPLLQSFGIYSVNPYDTFDWLLDMDERVKRSCPGHCEDVYFIIGTDRGDEHTESYIGDARAAALIEKLKNRASRIGMHISYEASGDEEEIRREKENIERAIGESVTINRNHYLRTRDVEDFRILLRLGVKEDFTMGYADRPGFRLGTSRCVKWIDPVSLEVTELMLHPLTVMEGTLQDYMKLDADAAYELITKLLGETRKHHGDFTMLFHNSSFRMSRKSMMTELYERALCAVTGDAVETAREV